MPLHLNDFRPSRLVAATDSFKDVIIIYTVASLISTTTFALIEGIPWLDAFYWAGITATSLGYGDITPKTEIGKLVAYLWAHVAIYGIAPLVVVRYMENIMGQRDTFTHAEQQRMFKELCLMREMICDLHQQKFPAKNFIMRENN